MTHAVDGVVRCVRSFGDRYIGHEAAILGRVQSVEAEKFRSDRKEGVAEEVLIIPTISPDGKLADTGEIIFEPDPIKGRGPRLDGHVVDRDAVGPARRIDVCGSSNEAMAKNGRLGSRRRMRSTVVSAMRWPTRCETNFFQAR